MPIISAMSTKTFIAIVVLLVLVLLALLRIFFRKLGKNLPGSVSWRQYLKDQGLVLFMFLLKRQGLVLFMFLLIGGGLASFSAYFGPVQGKVSKGVQLIEFDKLNPTEHPIYEEINVENYSNITVFTRTNAPPNGSAMVAIYADQRTAAADKSAVKRFDSVATSWSRWDQQNSSKRISLVVTPATEPNTASATEVQILVYLSPREK